MTTEAARRAAEEIVSGMLRGVGIAVVRRITTDRTPLITEVAAIIEKHIPASPGMQEGLSDLIAICRRLQEELRLIRMKDCGAVYDTTIRIEAESLLDRLTGRKQQEGGE